VRAAWLLLHQFCVLLLPGTQVPHNPAWRTFSVCIRKCSTWKCSFVTLACCLPCQALAHPYRVIPPTPTLTHTHTPNPNHNPTHPTQVQAQWQEGPGGSGLPLVAVSTAPPLPRVQHSGVLLLISTLPCIDLPPILRFKRSGKKGRVDLAYHLSPRGCAGSVHPQWIPQLQLHMAATGCESVLLASR
jgi:hypothetical protein